MECSWNKKYEKEWVKIKGKGKMTWKKGEGVGEEGLMWGWNIWKLRCRKLYGGSDVTTHDFIAICNHTDMEVGHKKKMEDAQEEMERMRKGR